MLGELAMAIASDDEDSNDEELVDTLLLGACEPLVKDVRQQIGPERLSLARLQREAAAAGLDADTASRNIYKNFRFRLEELPRVVAALDPPHGFRTNSGAVFSGEEGVLMLLRRFATTATLLDLVWELGRSTTQISEAVRYMVEFVHRKHLHLLDERSFIAWESSFADFAAALLDVGVTLPNAPTSLASSMASSNLFASLGATSTCSTPGTSVCTASSSSRASSSPTASSRFLLAR